jgi:hypothetical protein
MMVRYVLLYVMLQTKSRKSRPRSRRSDRRNAAEVLIRPPKGPRFEHTALAGRFGIAVRAVFPQACA